MVRILLIIEDSNPSKPERKLISFWICCSLGISIYFISKNQNKVAENNSEGYMKETENITNNQSTNSSFTLDSTVEEVMNDKAFE